MEITKHYCDHCGKELVEDDAYEDIDIDAGKYFNTHIDLCGVCYQFLNDMLVHFIDHKGEVNLEWWRNNE